MPKVSVITPCYNSAKYVGQTITSVCRQSLADWEHIVVDDGSQDGSAGMITTFARQDGRIQLLSEPHQGVASARNHGFRAARSDSPYLLFLDADDCLEPRMLEVLSHYLDLHPEVGLVRCGYRFIDQESRFMDYPESKHRYVPSGLWLRQLDPEEPETPFLSVFTLCGIIPSIALIRRSVFEQTQGFDEDFGHHHEDTHLFLQLALRSRIHYFPESLVLRRRHPAQNTVDTPEFREKAYRQLQKLYAEWLGGEGLTLEQKRTVKEAWRFKEGRLEPYLAFLRARRAFQNRELVKALRNLLGGARRYVTSFVPAGQSVRGQ